MPNYRPLCALYITGEHTVCFTETEQMRRFVLYLESLGHSQLMAYMLFCVSLVTNPEAREKVSPDLVEVMLMEMLRAGSMGVITSLESFRRLSSFQLILVGSSWSDRELSALDVHEVDEETKERLRESETDMLVITAAVPATPEGLFDED